MQERKRVSVKRHESISTNVYPTSRKAACQRILESNIMLESASRLALIIPKYLFYAAIRGRNKQRFTEEDGSMSHRSPCSRSSGWLHVCHAWKEIFSPKCLFPTAKASVRPVLGSDPGMVHIHFGPLTGWQMPKPRRLSGPTHSLCFTVSVRRNITSRQRQIHGPRRAPALPPRR